MVASYQKVCYDKAVKLKIGLKTLKEEAKMLFGEYSHQVDAKNRIRIPSKFKQELASGYYFVMGNSKCISIYPAENM